MRNEFFDKMQRRADPAYRKRMENKEMFIQQRQASFERYMAGEINKEQHEANVAALRHKYLR